MDEEPETGLKLDTHSDLLLEVRMSASWESMRKGRAMRLAVHTSADGPDTINRIRNQLQVLATRGSVALDVSPGYEREVFGGRRREMVLDSENDNVATQAQQAQ